MSLSNYTAQGNKMFFGKKKTQLEILINKDGVEHAAKRLAEIINEKIPIMNP